MENKKSFSTDKLKSDALNIRLEILKLAFESGGGQHLGGELIISMVEIMCYLYSYLIDVNSVRAKLKNRNRFILSKGHGVLGFLSSPSSLWINLLWSLKTYKQELSELISHPIRNLDYGIESSNGSLGHGLSYGAEFML